MTDEVDSPIPIGPRRGGNGNGTRDNGAPGATGDGPERASAAVPLWDRIASQRVAGPSIEAAPAKPAPKPREPARAEPAAPPHKQASAAEPPATPPRGRRRAAEPRDGVSEPRPARAPARRRRHSGLPGRSRHVETWLDLDPAAPGGDGAGGAGGNGGDTGDGDGASPSGLDAGRPKPRLRKLRLLAVLSGLAALALVSFVFGVLMSVASDIPLLENAQQFQHEEKNSTLYDDHGHLIGVLKPAQGPVVVPHLYLISGWMQKAVVSVEDRRFWSEPGIDLRGILRAIVSDVTGGATQGASTITEQFVKNALQEQNNRTIFEKLREAALAFHLSHRWHKSRILREYLNSVYFGNGAYGVESAARIYFGKARNLGYDPSASADGATGGCGNSANSYCASRLDIAQSALLAGLIASPGQFNPLANPHAAWDRRDVVLKDMLAQHYITRAEYVSARNEPLPGSADIGQPQEPPAAPYFASWVEPQIVKVLERRGLSQKVAQYRAYYGGLKIKTTLDLSLQRAADQAVEQALPYGPGEPTASLVAIDNHTGEVRAMVGGPVVNGQEDYQKYPFNLATEGHRQPGSAFKPFTLAVALEDGIGPDSTWVSAPQDFIVPNSGGKEHFYVHNFQNQYSGVTTLQSATDYSDNSVFAQVGIKVGTARVAKLSERMGIRSPVSDNYAMILGAMKDGVTPLDMAHAYETFATGGLRVWNPVLGDVYGGPIGIHEIDSPGGGKLVNSPADGLRYTRILPVPIAQEVQTMLQGPVQQGTATAAQIPGVPVSGKTGTTTNYGDAWFVGWTPQLTVAVWVGFPNKLIPMSTLYNGGPVEGGTFPAIIWHSFMVQALQILAQEAAASSHGKTTTTATPVLTTGVPAAPTSTVGPSTTPAATAPTGTTPAAGTTPTAPTHTTTPAPAGNTGGGTQGNQGATPNGSTGGGTNGGSTSGGNTGGTGIGGAGPSGGK
jgi:penicillin-binding protein 1A